MVTLSLEPTMGARPEGIARDIMARAVRARLAVGSTVDAEDREHLLNLLSPEAAPESSKNGKFHYCSIPGGIIVPED